MAKAAQNSPKVMTFSKVITIQKTMATICGIQKKMELALEMILVYLQEAKHHF